LRGKIYQKEERINTEGICFDKLILILCNTKKARFVSSFWDWVILKILKLLVNKNVYKSFSTKTNTKIGKNIRETQNPNSP